MSETLWGGRFSSGPHPDMLRLTRSVEVDMRLLPHDLESTKAHARVLVKAGLLEEPDLEAIDEECDALQSEWECGELIPGPLDEDVHSVVERELTDRLGDVGARIHAGRSRNDLVAQDLRLWCKEAAARLAQAVDGLVAAIAARAEEHVETVMPGFTHLQRAQPVSVAFYLCAHGAAFSRDRQRFETAQLSADVCVLGAGALAGTTLPLDAAVAQEELGLGGIFLNAMDAVSDRDFAADLLYACALCGVHLSRLAEEIVLFSSSEFGYVLLPDAWSTGSSMMPQKRNPDLAELIRGRSAGGIGDLTSMLTLLKGIPLAYDRDLQEDKEHVFSAVDRIDGCIEAMTRLIEVIGFNTERLAEAARGGAMWATDVAEGYVKEGMPFRRAHETAGKLVAAVEAMTRLIEVIGFNTERLEEAARGGAMWATDVAEGYVKEGMPFRRAHETAGKLVAAVEAGTTDPAAEPRIPTDPASSMAARASHGGTAPSRVKEQISALRSKLGQPRKRPADLHF